MIKLKKTDYVLVKGKRFFFIPANGLMCAHCLFMQATKLIRNQTGLIIGYDISMEYHSLDCAQRQEKI